MAAFSNMDPAVLVPDARRTLRAKVNDFVGRHFRLAGTLKLHGAALGWDLLRAPVNVALAPVFLLTKLAALLFRSVGLRRSAAWLGARRVLLPTSVSRAVTERIRLDLLQGAELDPKIRKLIEDYAGVRSAVSEITTTLVVLAAGIALFGSATPGIVSLAPNISGYVVYSSAVENFPLGARLGKVWYGTFPVTQPLWFVTATGVALAMAASVLTTFAGIVADPIQARLGIHQRRLMRLLERIALAEGASPRLAPEHILARLADLADAGVSLVRVFRP